MLANVFTKTARDRWRGTAIGAGSLALLLYFGMSLYRQFDLSVYDSLPDVVRSIINLPEGTDVAGLAYGAIYGTYGALTLAALALAMGSGAIAGEERDGTIGLLLANPASRTKVLVSKAAAMVALIAVASIVLWGAGLLSPALLDVAIGGTHVGALVFHIFVNAVFYGMLALAVGAWTGNAGLASGAATGVMVVSLFAVGIFQVVSGWENVAKAFPWYYFDAGSPLINGVAWGHIAVLLAGCTVLAVVAVAGVNRRDLKTQTVGVTLVDRLRANPMTRKVADRLAGSTRVSRISVKTASEHQGVTLVTGALMFAYMGVLIGPLYNLIDPGVLDFSGDLPDELMTLFGMGDGDMSTPVGWYRGETFGLVAPIAALLVGIVVGSRALAGEEARRTMGLLLANPVSRTSILLQKAAAMTLLVITVGVATFSGVTIGSLLGGLDIGVANIAAVSVLMTLLGLVFGGLALALGAATGRVRPAAFGAIGAGLVLHVANALLPLNESLAGLSRFTPFHYYTASDPLANGLDWGHAAVLAGLAAALIAVSMALFRRRDLCQKG